MPKLLWDRFVHGKYRHSFGQRMGFGLPKISRTGKPLVWIHAVSVGELRAIVPLARELKDKDLVVTTVTETGQVEALKLIPEAIAHFYLPFDFHWLVTALVHRISPDLVLLSEGDFWPGFQRAVVSSGGRIVLVSGKLSKRSAKRLMRFSSISHFVLGPISRFCVQNKVYAERYRSVGVASELIAVTGNLKFDAPVSRLNSLELWKKELNIQEGEKVVVLGSTHNPEEQWLLDALKNVPNLKILLVPRHPERFDQVAGLLHLQGESYFRLSQGGEGRIVLVDCMGKLGDCYQAADVAIVAGSFVAHVGGHNILEPCDYGVPVLFGPYMETQEEMVSLLLKADAGRQVSMDRIAIEVERASTSMGERGRELMKTLRGSVKRTLSELDI